MNKLFLRHAGECRLLEISNITAILHEKFATL